MLAHILKPRAVIKASTTLLLGNHFNELGVPLPLSYNPSEWFETFRLSLLVRNNKLKARWLAPSMFIRSLRAHGTSTPRLLHESCFLAQEEQWMQCSDNVLEPTFPHWRFDLLYEKPHSQMFRRSHPTSLTCSPTLNRLLISQRRHSQELLKSEDWERRNQRSWMR